METLRFRITTTLLVLLLASVFALIGMLATGVRGGPLDPPGAPDSTMKSLDDIPGSWSRALPANDGVAGPDPPAGCDSSRFECLEDFYNAAVLDRETGLVWYIEPLPIGQSWSAAHQYCQSFPVGTVVGERRGWRLPAYEELLSLVSTSAAPPRLPNGHPFTVATTDSYWTATTTSATNAREFSFATASGSVNGEPKASENYAWCVRGGVGYNPGAP